MVIKRLIKLQVSKASPKNNSEKNEEEILGERSISPKLRPKITDALRLKEENWRKKLMMIIIDDLRLI